MTKSKVLRLRINHYHIARSAGQKRQLIKVACSTCTASISVVVAVGALALNSAGITTLYYYVRCVCTIKLTSYMRFCFCMAQLISHIKKQAFSFNLLLTWETIYFLNVAL
jgi:hypothetical protein